MPVRIYDLAKKLGIESKQVLAKAKDLGVKEAKLPSSSLDKYTAQDLENELVKDHPRASATAQAVPIVPQCPAPLTIISEPVREHMPHQAKSPGITIRTINPEIHGLVERIFAGVIPFVLEVSRDEGSPPLRAKLVQEVSLATVASRPRLEPIRQAELDENTKRIFLGAYYFASSASKDGWVNLAEYGSTLKKQDATFQPQDFGEKTLGALVRRMIDIFDIKADGNTPPVYHIRLKPQASIIQSQPTATPPQETILPRHHAIGKVHNLKLGFGFIAPDDGSENAFFHSTEVIGCTIFDLRPGDPVEYEAGVNERGPCAWKVRRLG